MKNVTIFYLNKNYYYFSSIDKSICNMVPICTKRERLFYRLCKYFPKIVERRIIRKIPKNTDTIIIFDFITRYLPNLVKRIPAKYEKILYIWNMIDKSHDKVMENINYFNKVYSFSESDCKKYNFNYLPLMAHPISDISKDLKYDCFFLGYLKNRKEFILDMHNKIKKFNSKFIIVSNKELATDGIDLRNSRLSYLEYINYLNESKCVIDIANPGQDGYTLRIAEAICYNKKIITTNANIKNEKIYNSNNILIYDSNTTIEEIENFLEKPTVLYPQDSIFIFENWLKLITEN